MAINWSQKVIVEDKPKPARERKPNPYLDPRMYDDKNDIGSKPEATD